MTRDLSGVSGGPQDALPPLRPVGKPPKNPKSTTRKVLALGYAALMLAALVGGFLWSRYARSPGQTTTVAVSPPRIPELGTQQSLAQSCSDLALAVAKATVVMSTAGSDLANGRSTLPSVSSPTLTETISNLHALALRAPAPLSNDLDSYASYFVGLRKLKNGEATTTPNSADASTPLASITADCEHASD